MQHWKK